MRQIRRAEPPLASPQENVLVLSKLEVLAPGAGLAMLKPRQSFLCHYVSPEPISALRNPVSIDGYEPILNWVPADNPGMVLTVPRGLGHGPQDGR